MIPNITLKAKLQVYSKVPFYTDTIREAPIDSNSYVRKDGVWVKLDTTMLEGELDKFNSAVESLTTNVNNLKLERNPVTESLEFTNAQGITNEIKFPRVRVDHLSIGMTQDTDTLYAINKPDEETITLVDKKWETNQNDISIDFLKEASMQVIGIYSEDKNAVITGDALYKLEQNVKDLETIVQGVGGFLDPHNFGQSFVSGPLNLTEINTKLSDYAYQELYKGDVREIPNQTKVKNIYDGSVWVWVSKKGSWQYQGTDGSAIANNNGVLGNVTGDSQTKFAININAEGKMSVNGLAEEFTKVVYKDNVEGDGNLQNGAVVVRNERGTIQSSDPTEPLDVVNLQSFNSWVDEVSFGYSEADLNQIEDWFQI